MNKPYKIKSVRLKVGWGGEGDGSVQKRFVSSVFKKGEGVLKGGSYDDALLTRVNHMTFRSLATPFPSSLQIATIQ